MTVAVAQQEFPVAQLDMVGGTEFALFVTRPTHFKQLSAVR